MTDNNFKINITSEKGVNIQPNMYGLFFEDINYAADGGIYAEMIENRSFEQIMHNDCDGGTKETYRSPGYAWSAVDGVMHYKTENGLNEINPHYLEFSGRKFKNKAYEGMYVEAGKSYKVSFYAKADTYNGTVSASAVNNGIVAFSGIIAESVTGEWKKYESILTAEVSIRYGDFVISLEDVGTVCFDMISVIPCDAVCGVFRRDLAEMLKEMKPGFLRFPGGCVIEGWDIENRYQWKHTVGPAQERTQNWNRWAVSKRPKYLDYNQTYGLGFYEYFLLCEYLECDPLPVLNVGLSCQYQGKETVPVYAEDSEKDIGVEINGVTYSTEFYQYIQDALDLIEFCNGDESTLWGGLRSSMGPIEPVNLTLLGVGNEQWEADGNQWYERYEEFEKVIHSVYPDIKIISSAGPSPDGDNFDSAWTRIKMNMAENTGFTYAVDEHFYKPGEWFLNNDLRYDGYDRSIKVFAGEYAAEQDGNTLYSAVTEAAFMTGLERNADVVYMASYAPLFCRINYMQWETNMIWFNDMTCYGTPNYYVQSMYMNNSGDYTLKYSITGGNDKNYLSVCYNKNSNDIIVKIANPSDRDISVDLDLSSFSDTAEFADTAHIEILTGESSGSENSIDNPQNIAPKRSEIILNDNIKIPSLSFAVIRIHILNQYL